MGPELLSQLVSELVTMANRSLELGAIHLSVVVPCFNEASHIEAFVRSWVEHLSKLEIVFDFTVINDGSTDGTGRILDSLRREFKCLRVFHQLKSGHGKSIRRGYEAARGEFIFQTDANGRYETTDFPRLWEERHNFDLILGNRIHRLDPIMERAFSQRLRRAFKKIAAPLEDPASSFRLFRREVADEFLTSLPTQCAATNLLLSAFFASRDSTRVLEVGIPHRVKREKERNSLGAQVGQGFSLIAELVSQRRKFPKQTLHSA